MNDNNSDKYMLKCYDERAVACLYLPYVKIYKNGTFNSHMWFYFSSDCQVIPLPNKPPQLNSDYVIAQKQVDCFEENSECGISKELADFLNQIESMTFDLSKYELIDCIPKDAKRIEFPPLRLHEDSISQGLAIRLAEEQERQERYIAKIQDRFEQQITNAKHRTQSTNKL